MDIKNAIELIQPAVDDRYNQVWLDLGAGEGLFTRALARTLHSGIVHAIDKVAFPALADEGNVSIVRHAFDFEKTLPEISPVHGVLLANSLHFIRDKAALLNHYSRLMDAPQFIIVEYDISVGSRWVPFPIRFYDLKEIVHEQELGSMVRVGHVDSAYHSEGMYCALIKGLHTTSSKTIS